MSARFIKVKIEGKDVWVLRFRMCRLIYSKVLPKIDKNRKTPLFVYWYSPKEKDGATGDGQVWAWFPGASYYVPMQRVSYRSGVPEGDI